MIDPRLLVEGISKAMLPQDSSITDQELCQALARYLHHNSDEIAMNVIYPQLPLDAPTGKRISTQTMQLAAADAIRWTT